MDINRRNFLVKSGAAVVAGAAMAALPASSVAQAAAVAAAASPLMVKAKPLPFDPQKIKGISEKLLISHHGNNYTGAVNRLNTIREQLLELNWDTAPGYIINGLKREEMIAVNSTHYHEMYFAGLGGDGPPAGQLAARISKHFGSYEAWRRQFVATGKALAGGSGWVTLSYDTRDGTLFNTWSADHAMGFVGGRPILVMDMYEHAYHMDYGAKAADYVTAYMNNINWKNAETLLAEITV